MDYRGGSEGEVDVCFVFCVLVLNGITAKSLLPRFGKTKRATASFPVTFYSAITTTNVTTTIAHPPCIYRQ